MALAGGEQVVALGYDVLRSLQVVRQSGTQLVKQVEHLVALEDALLASQRNALRILHHVVHTVNQFV